MFQKIINLFHRQPKPIKPRTERNKSTSANDPVFELHVTFSGPKPPPVPKELLEKEYQKWKFITENEPIPIGSKNRWFNPNRRVNKDIKGLPRWMSPILPKTDFEDEEIRNQLLLGPENLRSVAVALRKRIRVKRKRKESIREELDFLYCLAVLDDLIEKCVFPQIEGVHGENIIQHFSKSDLERIVIDYGIIGYELLSLLNKTDKKWLSEEISIPQGHNSVADLFPEVLNNAISRHCWHELSEQNLSRAELGQGPKSIEEWLKNHLEQFLGYALEWKERIERSQEREAKESEVKIDVQESLRVFSGDFVIADLETTGLRSDSDAIIELGAIKIRNGFAEHERFSTLVFTDGEIPNEITQLTGITGSKLGKDGVKLSQALHDFQNFVGELPVFFHNAAFDRSFLQSAFKQIGLNFDMRIFDTLGLFRNTWPELPNHKLRDLCRQFSIKGGDKHRALADCDALAGLIKLAVEKNEANEINSEDS